MAIAVTLKTRGVGSWTAPVVPRVTPVASLPDGHVTAVDANYIRDWSTFDALNHLVEGLCVENVAGLRWVRVGCVGKQEGRFLRVRCETEVGVAVAEVEAGDLYINRKVLFNPRAT